jgi:hypothetical protein
MKLKVSSAPYILTSIITGSVVAITGWLTLRDTTWMLPLTVTAAMWIVMCLWFARLQIVLEDHMLSYRTLTGGTAVVAFSDIRQISNESGRENVADVGPIAVSRLIIQLKTGHEVTMNLQAFRAGEVHAFLGSLQRKCQCHGVHYANLHL